MPDTFSYRDLHHISRGSPRAAAIGCMLEESPRQPWPITQKGASHVWFGVFVRWSLTLAGKAVNPDEKNSLKYVCVFTDTLNYEHYIYTLTYVHLTAVNCIIPCSSSGHPHLPHFPGLASLPSLRSSLPHFPDETPLHPTIPVSIAPPAPSWQ